MIRAYTRNGGCGYNIQLKRLVNGGKFKIKGLLMIFKGKGAIITQNLVVEYADNTMKIHPKKTTKQNTPHPKYWKNHLKQVKINGKRQFGYID